MANNHPNFNLFSHRFSNQMADNANDETDANTLNTPNYDHHSNRNIYSDPYETNQQTNRNTNENNRFSRSQPNNNNNNNQTNRPSNIFDLILQQPQWLIAAGYGNIHITGFFILLVSIYPSLNRYLLITILFYLQTFLYGAVLIIIKLKVSKINFYKL